MKVLHVIPSLNSGGAEKMLVNLIGKMKNQGCVPSNEEENTTHRPI